MNLYKFHDLPYISEDIFKLYEKSVCKRVVTLLMFCRNFSLSLSLSLYIYIYIYPTIFYFIFFFSIFSIFFFLSPSSTLLPLMFSSITLSVSFFKYLFFSCFQFLSCPVSWNCRIHQLHLCRGVRLPPMSVLIWHSTICLWGSSPGALWSTSLLPLLLGPLWPREETPDRVLSMGQIELFDHLIVCKQMTDV